VIASFRRLEMRAPPRKVWTLRSYSAVVVTPEIVTDVESAL
jgi:hypothetical protein